MMEKKMFSIEKDAEKSEEQWNKKKELAKVNK